MPNKCAKLVACLIDGLVHIFLVLHFRILHYWLKFSLLSLPACEHNLNPKESLYFVESRSFTWCHHYGLLINCIRELSYIVTHQYKSWNSRFQTRLRWLHWLCVYRARLLLLYFWHTSDHKDRIWTMHWWMQKNGSRWLRAVKAVAVEAVAMTSSPDWPNGMKSNTTMHLFSIGTRG